MNILPKLEKKIIRELKEISAMKHISDLEPEPLIPNDMEINPRESMEGITLMIKIKSKENSFLNSRFESLHKRFDQYHLNDSSMQVLNTRICKESVILEFLDK